MNKLIFDCFAGKWGNSSLGWRMVEKITVYQIEHEMVRIARKFSPLFCRAAVRFLKKTEAKSHRNKQDNTQKKTQDKVQEQKCDKRFGFIKDLREFSKAGISEELVRLQQNGLLEFHPYFTLALRSASNMPKEERLKELEDMIDAFKHDPNSGLSRWEHCSCGKAHQVLCRRLRTITQPEKQYADDERLSAWLGYSLENLCKLNEKYFLAVQEKTPVLAEIKQRTNENRELRKQYEPFLNKGFYTFSVKFPENVQFYTLQNAFQKFDNFLRQFCRSRDIGFIRTIRLSCIDLVFFMPKQQSNAYASIYLFITQVKDIFPISLPVKLEMDNYHENIAVLNFYDWIISSSRAYKINIASVPQVKYSYGNPLGGWNYEDLSLL